MLVAWQPVPGSVTVAVCDPIERFWNVPLQLVDTIVGLLSSVQEQVGVPTAPVTVAEKLTFCVQVGVRVACAVMPAKLNSAGPARSLRSGLVPPEPEERVMTEPKNCALHAEPPPVKMDVGTAASAKISGHLPSWGTRIRT